MTVTQNSNHNANDGRLIFRKTGVDTNGELLEMETTYPPNSAQPPYHYHPFQAENFEVLQGKFHTKIDEVENTYQVGGKFIVSKNTPHWMYNISEQEGCLLYQVHPAMKTLAFFESMRGLEADSKTNSNGLPKPL